MFVVGGTDDLAEAGTYCEEVRTRQGALSKDIGNAAAAACYHGIGHAILNASPTDAYGNDSRMAQLGVEACEHVSTDEAKQVQCDSGVFNSLVNAYQDGTYRVSFRQDPASICDEQPKKARLVCYKEVVVQYLNHTRHNFADSIAYIGTIPQTYKPEVLFSYIDNHIRHQQQNPSAEQIKSICALGNKEDITSCIRGAQYALASMGEPHKEYIQMFALCGLYPGDNWERDYCMTQAVETLRNVYTPAELARACASTSVSKTSSACAIP